MKRLIKKLIKNENGQVLVLSALMMVVLMGCAALVIDVGVAHSTKTKMQNAADAAALAGAQNLPTASAAISAAKNYAESNGAEKLNTIATTPYNGDSTKIEVVCTKNVQYSFARVLGFTDKNVSARAVAEKAGMGGGPFNYTVFSGDPHHTLTFNGSDTTINGSAHSNDKFSINGSNLKITGSIEAISTLTINGSSQNISGDCQAAQITLNGSNINIKGDKINEAAPWIDMPDFSDLIKAEAEAAGEVYSGNKTYDGSNINVDSPIYVNGNLTVNGSSFKGKGVILVSGDITFNGSNLSSLGNSVCFYSKNGNITINGSGIELHGLVYAPNGTIKMNGSNQTVKGRIIGKKLDFNGSNYEFTSGAGDLESLPRGSVKLVE